MTNISQIPNYSFSATDYLPIWSSLEHFYHLADYILFSENHPPTADHSYSSLSPGSALRSIILLIPVLGNIIIAIHDWAMVATLASMQTKEQFMDALRTKKQQVTLADSHYFSDIEVMEVAAQNNALPPEVLSEIKSKEIFQKIVSIDGMYLEHAQDPFKDNPEVVRAAVGQNGLSIQFASARQKSNPKTLGIASIQNPEAAFLASPHRKSNGTFSFSPRKEFPQNFDIQQFNT